MSIIRSSDSKFRAVSLTPCWVFTFLPMILWNAVWGSGRDSIRNGGKVEAGRFPGADSISVCGLVLSPPSPPLSPSVLQTKKGKTNKQKTPTATTKFYLPLECSAMYLYHFPPTLCFGSTEKWWLWFGIILAQWVMQRNGLHSSPGGQDGVGTRMSLVSVEK